MPRDRQPAPGQVPELWVIAPDGVPRSIGVGSDAPMQAMTVPDAMREGLLRAGLQQTGAILAVSMEPPGGSPTGRPRASSRAGVR
jgi:anti-sigma-K factor RskA